MIWLWIAAGLIVIFGAVVFRGAPYVPSHRRYVRQAFNELYKLGPNDFLVDIGSGDGVVLRQAAKTGSKAVGYEINPILVLISRLASFKNPLITVRLADYWKVDFPDQTTICYIFAVTRDTKRTVQKIQQQSNQLNKTIRVISYGSKLPGLVIDKQLAAHSLYTVNPLHPASAQV